MAEDGVGQEIRKRNVAFKLRIGDILKGAPMMSEGRFLFLELGGGTPLDSEHQTGRSPLDSEHQTGRSPLDSEHQTGRRVVRVNVLANCIDKFLQEGERKFGTLTVDDASGQIKLKAFGDDVEILKKVVQGDTLQIVGNLREWNGEIYILPEIVKSVDSRWLLVRKLEIQNARKDMPVSEKGDSGLKNSILEKIKGAEADGGIDVDAIIMDVEASPDAINGEVKKLLEEGLVYEPRPGRLRYLG